MSKNGFHGLKPGLSAFIHNQPEGAYALLVRTLGATSSETMMALDAKKLAEQDASEIAEHVMATCSDWAESAGQECAFLVQWLDAGRQPLTTHRFKSGMRDSAVPFNGTAESIIAQMQGHIHALMKLHNDQQKPLLDAYERALARQDDRIKFLEKRNAGMEAEVEKARDIITIGEDPLIGIEQARFNKLVEAGERLVWGLLTPPDEKSDAGNGSAKTTEAAGEAV